MEDEDEDFCSMLESKRLDIIEHLHVDRTFVFDYLRSKSVLDTEDCELIHSEKTTARKVGKFVDILAKKGAEGYRHLLESLQLENPLLYKMLTGKEANATDNPIMTKLKNSYLGLGDPLENGELAILSKHLERTYGDLHEMSIRFEQVVQQKKSIEDRLETTIDDLKRNQETVEDLTKKVDCERGTCSIHHNLLMKCLQYMDTLRREKSDCDIYIIALQTKLMTAKEEITELEKKNTNMTTKNEELQKAIHEIRESHTLKRRETFRISERINMQGDGIKKAEQITKKYREHQFQNMMLREENTHLQNEVEELQKSLKALKVRFGIVKSEEAQTMTNQTTIIEDFGNAQKKLMQCNNELNEAQSIAADLGERVRHLELDKEMYKKQRDAALAQRRDAILDRDKAYLERIQAQTKYNEMKAKSEADMECSIVEMKSFDEVVARNDVIEDEMNRVRTKLRETERELEEMKAKCPMMNMKDYDEQDNSETFIRSMPSQSGNKNPAAEQPTLSREAEQGPGEDNKTSTRQIVDNVKRRTSDSPGLSSPEDFAFQKFPPQVPGRNSLERSKKTRKSIHRRTSDCLLEARKERTPREGGVPTVRSLGISPRRHSSEDALNMYPYVVMRAPRSIGNVEKEKWELLSGLEDDHNEAFEESEDEDTERAVLPKNQEFPVPGGNSTLRSHTDDVTPAEHARRRSKNLDDEPSCHGP